MATDLERRLAEMGIYPAVDPLASTSRALAPEIVGEEHYNVARQVQQTLQRYRELQDIIALLGMDELSDEDKIIVTGPREFSSSDRKTSMSPNNLPDNPVPMFRSKRRYAALKKFFPETWTISRKMPSVS